METNQKISFSYDDLVYMSQLAKDREFKVQIKDNSNRYFNYSYNFLLNEQKILPSLREKLEKAVNQFREKMYPKQEEKENE